MTVYKSHIETPFYKSILDENESKHFNFGQFSFSHQQ